MNNQQFPVVTNRISLNGSVSVVMVKDNIALSFYIILAPFFKIPVILLLLENICVLFSCLLNTNNRKNIYKSKNIQIINIYSCMF